MDAVGIAVSTQFPAPGATEGIGAIQVMGKGVYLQQNLNVEQNQSRSILGAPLPRNSIADILFSDPEVRQRTRDMEIERLLRELCP